MRSDSVVSSSAVDFCYLEFSEKVSFTSWGLRRCIIQRTEPAQGTYAPPHKSYIRVSFCLPTYRIGVIDHKYDIPTLSKYST